jgi:hypothetical protein
MIGKPFELASSGLEDFKDPRRIPSAPLLWQNPRRRYRSIFLFDGTGKKFRIRIHNTACMVWKRVILVKQNKRSVSSYYVRSRSGSGSGLGIAPDPGPNPTSHFLKIWTLWLCHFVTFPPLLILLLILLVGVCVVFDHIFPPQVPNPYLIPYYRPKCCFCKGAEFFSKAEF